ncbi:hypothetical protein HYW82_00175 [Candidatus Peregrinibacteria bacterium]|nr:hypothetical protein [Candidatus Peregrinibacteria bacterium]
MAEQGQTQAEKTTVAPEAPAAAPAADARAEQADSAASELFNPVEIQKLKAKQTRIDQAKTKIFAMVSSNADTPYAEHAEDYIKMSLVYPLDRLALKLDRIDSETLQKRIDRIVISAQGYVKAINDSNLQRLTPDKLAEAKKSLSRKAQNFARLVAYNDIELVYAFQAAAGLQGKEGSVDANIQKAKQILPDKINQWLDKGENGLMPCIWMILSFMESADRREIAKTFIKAHSDKSQKFLDEGNMYGVFSLDEMEKIRGAQYGDAEERLKYQKKWEVNNRFTEEAKRLAKDSYGSYNDANRSITVGNTLIFLGKAASVATVVANVGFGVWKNDAWKNPALLAKSMLENPYIMGGGAAFMALNEFDQNTSAEEFFADSDTRVTEKNRRAKESLTERLKGSHGDQWRAFFNEDNGHGIKIFAYYAEQMQILDRLDADNFTKAGFLQFLKSKEGSAHPVFSGVDCERIAKTFEKVNDKELVEMARALADLGITSGEAHRKYPEFLNQIGLS